MIHSVNEPFSLPHWILYSFLTIQAFVVEMFQHSLRQSQVLRCSLQTRTHVFAAWLPEDVLEFISSLTLQGPSATAQHTLHLLSQDFWGNLRQHVFISGFLSLHNTCRRRQGGERTPMTYELSYLLLSLQAATVRNPYPSSWTQDRLSFYHLQQNPSR